MTQPFPTDDRSLSGPFAPVYAECDAPHLPIRGKLPEGLEGTLYRTGPNPQFAPAAGYHVFAGDGMLHAFRIARGRVSYKNRWARTPRWLLENELGAALPPGDPRLLAIAGLADTKANTHVIWFADRLLALEEAHLPFEMHPDSLASLGACSFSGELDTRMTAHPKVDPKTGELIYFGYAASGPATRDIALGVVDAQGHVSQKRRIEAPFASMVHDFAVTESWLVVPAAPLVATPERMAKGLGGAYLWEPERGMHIALVPRSGGEPRWIATDASFVYHFMNAYETADGTLVCDALEFPEAPNFPRADGTRRASPAQATLNRWRIDPAAGSIRKEALDDRAGEFPRIDDRFATNEYRHGYFWTEPTKDAGAGVGTIDLATGKTEDFRTPAGDFCGEPVFVPRSPTAPEGDGWLLTVVTHPKENRSELAILDASHAGDGPIATAELSHRVPMGFHGSFRGA